MVSEFLSHRSHAEADESLPPSQLFRKAHRIRDGEACPDAALWMIEDANAGGLFRVTPKQGRSRAVAVPIV